MALVLQINPVPDSILGVWERSEPFDWLITQLPAEVIDDERFKPINNQSRQTEWLITRILLAKLLGKFEPIGYHENGKPFLANAHYHISITHSKNHVALLLSESQIPGIDIEHISPRAGKVATKFLSQPELNWCVSDASLTAAWSAKESIFKMKGNGLDFKDIRLEKFEILDSDFAINASILNEDDKEIKLTGRLIGPDVLTFGFYI